MDRKKWTNLARLDTPKMLAELIVFTLGLVAGSFFGLCAHRIPYGKPILLDVSRCDYCGVPLSWLHKLPLLGYVFLRGRTSCCRRLIPYRYAVLEVTTGIFFVLMHQRTMEVEKSISAIIFIGLLIVGALIDFEHRIIPDKVTLIGIAAGVLLAVWTPGHSRWAALFGIVICGGFLYLGGVLGALLLSRADAMGGGDMKFAAMIGAFLGWQQGLAAIILAACGGVVYGLSVAVAHHGLRFPKEIRFGPFLALGGLANYFWGESIVKWYLSMTGWNAI